MCSEADIIFAIDTTWGMYIGDDGNRIKNVSAAFASCSALIMYIQITEFMYSIMSFNESSNYTQEPIWAPSFSHPHGIWYGVYAFNAGKYVLTQ